MKRVILLLLLLTLTGCFRGDYSIVGESASYYDTDRNVAGASFRLGTTKDVIEVTIGNGNPELIKAKRNADGIHYVEVENPMPGSFYRFRVTKIGNKTFDQVSKETHTPGSIWIDEDKNRGTVWVEIPGKSSDSDSAIDDLTPITVIDSNLGGGVRIMASTGSLEGKGVKAEWTLKSAGVELVGRDVTIRYRIDGGKWMEKAAKTDNAGKAQMTIDNAKEGSTYEFDLYELDGEEYETVDPKELELKKVEVKIPATTTASACTDDPFDYGEIAVVDKFSNVEFDGEGWSMTFGWQLMDPDEYPGVGGIIVDYAATGPLDTPQSDDSLWDRTQQDGRFEGYMYTLNPGTYTFYIRDFDTFGSYCGDGDTIELTVP